MKKIIQIAEFLRGTNFDIYIAFISAVIVAVLGFFGKAKVEVLESAILATLSFLLASFLETRRNNTELKNTIEKLTSELLELKILAKKKTSLEDIFTQGYPDLSHEIATAKNVEVLGVALSSTSSRYYSQFSQLLSNGGSLKFIMSETSTNLIDLMVLRSKSIRDKESQLHTCHGNLARTKSLMQFASNPEAIQIRAIPYIPSLGMISIEKANEPPTIYIHLVSFRNFGGSNPAFKVTKQTDLYWYEFFSKQFDGYWEVANPI